MRPLQPCIAAQRFLVLSATITPACITDSVPQEMYAASPPRASVDAAVDARKPTSIPTQKPSEDPDSNTEDDPDTEASAAPRVDAGASTPAADSGAAKAPCDLSGHWLITQRAVAQGLGVRQAGLWWYYYELEQSGSDLTVKRGLVCGGEVRPVDLLAASVDWKAAWPAILENNSHAGRGGTVTASGADCSLSFDRAYNVVGATTPYYADPSHPMPGLDEEASGETPGWEDWDEDGQPAVSLHVGGIVTGARYTALRAWAEWSGELAAGAENFQLAVTWNQEETILGVTTDLLKQTGVPDPDNTLHFAQFARLTPDQVQGDDAEVCATIRDLAPTLTSDADQ